MTVRKIVCVLRDEKNMVSQRCQISNSPSFNIFLRDSFVNTMLQSIIDNKSLASTHIRTHIRISG